MGWMMGGRQNLWALLGIALTSLRVLGLFSLPRGLLPSFAQPAIGCLMANLLTQGWFLQLLILISTH